MIAQCEQQAVRPANQEMVRAGRSIFTKSIFLLLPQVDALKHDDDVAFVVE